MKLLIVFFLVLLSGCDPSGFDRDKFISDIFVSTGAMPSNDRLRKWENIRILSVNRSDNLQRDNTFYVRIKVDEVFKQDSSTGMKGFSPTVFLQFQQTYGNFKAGDIRRDSTFCIEYAKSTNNIPSFQKIVSGFSCE